MSDADRPEILDLGQLERQTFGDRGLERELLALFDAQCVRLLPLVTGSVEERARADAAHTIRGASGAVGALALAAAAAVVESRPAGLGAAEARDVFARTVAATRDAVAARLHDP